MDLVSKLEMMVRFLQLRATANREETANAINELQVGLCEGYAHAYEICAEWLSDILEGEKK